MQLDAQLAALPALSEVGYSNVLQKKKENIVQQSAYNQLNHHVLEMLVLSNLFSLLLVTVMVCVRTMLQ